MTPECFRDHNKLVAEIEARLRADLGLSQKTGQTGGDIKPACEGHGQVTHCHVPVHCPAPAQVVPQFPTVWSGPYRWADVAPMVMAREAAAKNSWPGPPEVLLAGKGMESLLEETSSETDNPENTDTDTTTEEELLARLDAKMARRVSRYARDGARKLNRVKRCKGARRHGHGGGGTGHGGAGAGSLAW